MSRDTRIFIMAQVSTLLRTARNLRLEGERALAVSGELRDRATELLCVVSSLLATLAQAQREEAEELQEGFWKLGSGSRGSESEPISPLSLGEPLYMNEDQECFGLELMFNEE